MLPAIRLLPLVVICSVFASCSSTVQVDEGFVETNGTRLYYKTIGSGEPIVVLHGGPGFDHQQFLPHLNALAEHNRVIFYDQRGTGQSGGPVDSASITIENFIEDLEGIREAFGIEKMNLLGHSWGGMLAMHYGIRHPDRLKSLVLASTAASRQSSSDIRAAVEARRDPKDKALLDSIYTSTAFQAEDAKAIEAFWDVFFRVHFLDPDMAKKLHTPVTENTIRNGDTVAGRILASVGQFDLHEELASIDVPTLVIHGEADLLPVSYAHRTHESLPNSELVIIEGAGHWIFVDGNERFVEAVAEFVNRQ